MIFVAYALLTLLIAATLRRWVFLLASLLPARRVSSSTSRTIGILVPARNEERLVGSLLQAIDFLAYPSHLLRIVFVNDGSTDSTGAVIQGWMRGRVNGQGASAALVELPEAVGKAGAIRAGALQCPSVDLYVIFDADSEPMPDCLEWLAGAFEDSTVGAVGGYPQPGNSNESIVARYAALERWVHHLVTLAGKDRLGANPYANGAICAFRREAVEAIGGFPTDGIVEDVQISLALNRTGWRTRSIPQARVREDVVATLSGFLLQRERWSRGLMDSTPRARGAEDLFVVSGYLDRVILTACAAAALAGWLSPWWFAGYLTAPVSGLALAVWRAGVRNPLPYCLAVIAMSPVDIAASFSSLIHQIGAAPKRWNPQRDRHGASAAGAKRSGSINSADD